MILIVDSGSSKSDWLQVEQDGTVLNTYKTMGFNPYFHSAGFIGGEIRKNAGLAGLGDRILCIYYYGAGCSSEANQAVVKAALQPLFPKADISVGHDMAAAAYATYTGEPCITCILGTGSNAAYFDGKDLHSVNSGLGYILGDEASGTWFGKKLLAAWLYRQLPVDISDELQKEYSLSRETILHRVYEESHANVYLAGFTPFIARHRELPVFDRMLREAMGEFLRLHVACYPNYREVPTHFVGSVAYYFSSAIEEAAKEAGVRVGRIIQAPVEKLLEYHVKYVFPLLDHRP